MREVLTLDVDVISRVDCGMASDDPRENERDGVRAG